MTTIDIDAIRQREQAATPGPWGVGNGKHIVQDLQNHGGGVFTFTYPVAEVTDALDREAWGPGKGAEPKADAEFIAAARTDVPALLAKVDELTAELTALRQRVADMPPAWATFTPDDMHAAGLETVAAEMDRDALAADLATTRDNLTQSRAQAATYANEIGALKAELEQTRAEHADENAELNRRIEGRERAIGQYLDHKAKLCLHIEGLETQLAAQQPAINALREWAREDPNREGYDRVCARLVEAVDAMADPGVAR